MIVPFKEDFPITVKFGQDIHSVEDMIFVLNSSYKLELLR